MQGSINDIGRKTLLKKFKIMKHIRKFNESVEFDPQVAIVKIKEKFSEDDITQKYDEEILEWTDPDWEEEYESEYDWYIDHNNGEAQDVILSEMIEWYMSEFKVDLSTNQQLELRDAITDQSEYDCLRT
jgi:hypothetical protein